MEKRVQIIRCLVDGNSIRATSRIADVAIDTVIKLLKDVGQACDEYQDKMLRNLSCEKIQLDELWTFVKMKEKNVPVEQRGKHGIGDVWTWVAVDAKTKLIPTWFVGKRDAGSASVFINDLASRLASKVQLTSDGLKTYVEAIEGAFGQDVDYSQLVKIYGEPKEGQNKFNSDCCIGAKKVSISGNSDITSVSTSFVERQNLTMRMSMRRFTRKTNGFSKKLENLERAVSLNFMYYNFARIHMSLKVTPAMEAGIATHAWDIEEILALIPKDEPKKRGTYKKKISN